MVAVVNGTVAGCGGGQSAIGPSDFEFDFYPELVTRTSNERVRSVLFQMDLIYSSLQESRTMINEFPALASAAESRTTVC